MPVVNLFLDPFDGTNPNFIDPEDRKAREEEAEHVGRNSNCDVEFEPATPPDSPSANLKPGIIAPRHAPVTKDSAWGEAEGFTNAILDELEENFRDSHQSHAERHVKSQKLKAHFGDPSASDKNPLKTVIYSKSRELLEQEEKMRVIDAAARPKKDQARLTLAGTRKRTRGSDRPTRKYTWRFPEIKNKGSLRGRKQKMVGSKASDGLKTTSEDQDKTSYIGNLASKMIVSDDNDRLNSLFKETSNIEEHKSDGREVDHERNAAHREMVDLKSDAEIVVAEGDRRHNSVTGQSDDGQSACASNMYNEPTPPAPNTTTITSHQVSNKVKYWLNDMTEAAARSNDVVLMGALASLNGGVAIGDLDPVEELRVREMVEWYESAYN